MIRALGRFDAARRRTRGGFTLVELMVVILIIGILTSLFLLALAKATETAKAARTRSLITKIHNMLMARWDAYRTIRLPITAEAKGTGGNADLFNASNEQQRYRQNVARRRLFALRELLRMEMPDRYEDIVSFQPAVLVLPGSTTPVRPYLWNVYNRRIMASQAAHPVGKGMSLQEYWAYVSRQYESAECLYMILTSGIDDSSVSTEHFSPSDVGDKDSDGMPEFLDAWKNPIEFLRWAPGNVSPMQPVFRYSKSDWSSVFHPTQYTDPNNPDLLVSRWQMKVNQVVVNNMAALSNTKGKVVNKLLVIDPDDPFNPLRVGPHVDAVNASRSSRWRPGDPAPENGFLLIPLVYSCGPDFLPGINHYPGASIVSAPSQGGANGNAYFSDPYALYEDSASPSNVLYRGYRGCSQGIGRDFDNITNQQTVSE